MKIVLAAGGYGIKTRLAVHMHRKLLVAAVMFACYPCCAGDAQPTDRQAPFDCEWHDGGIIRGATGRKQMALVFTSHTFAEGGRVILDQLAQHHAKASFFLTGAFLTNESFGPLVRRILAEGHYLGPHSDQHLLYCSWDKDRRTLVTKEEFQRDLLANVDKITGYGVPRARIRHFLPAYENYNRQIASWTKDGGLALVNFTPGTRSTADYTGEAEPNFVSSQTIYDSIVRRERQDPHGLNGYLLLLHVGAGPSRTDKFHAHFGRLLDFLSARGYNLVRVDELLAKS